VVALRALAFAAAAALVPAAAPAAPATPVTIDVIASTTGNGGFFGASSVTAIKAYESRANAEGGIRGRPVHFAFVDDESNPQVAVQLATQIIAKHPAVFLGPTAQATCNAVGALVPSGPVDYCLSPGMLPPPRGYVFGASNSIVHIVPTFFRFIRGMGKTRVALLVTTDATGQRSDKMLAATLSLPENKAIAVVAYEHFADSDLTLAAQMARIKAGNPQFLYVSAAGSPFQRVLRGLIDAGLTDLPVITSSANMTEGTLAPFVKTPPSALYFNAPSFWGSGIEHVGPLKDAIAVYRATFKTLGAEPTPNDDFGWDPARIVIDALRHAGPDASAVQVHDYIENLHGFAGIAGMYDFRSGDQHGLGDDATIVVQWDPQHMVFNPASAGGGAPLH
jgi:branched-chain amino acid transport system substrate-binding protein